MPPATATGRRTAAIKPTTAERSRLRELLAVLNGHDAVLVTDEGRRIDAPPTAVQALTRAVEYLANGEPVMIIPANAQLTTGEAATILDVSRQYVVRLLDDGKIPSHREGSHRRVYLRDLIVYRERRIAEQMEAWRAMVRLGQETGGYDMTAEDIAAFSRDAGLDQTD
jgi:excisionase family DNA binding protein